MKIEKNKTRAEDEWMEFNLINGDFSFEEALEVVTHLLAKKINFHELKSFSCLIRTGSEDAISQNRIIELTKSKKKFESFMSNSKFLNSNLSIQSKINLKIIK